MFFTSDEQILTVLKMQERLPLISFLNEKRYRVGDTPLSYRQVNELGNDNLLKDDRENTAGWRKFSFKELLFFMVASELKELGVENEMLRPLSTMFFQITRKDKSPHNETDDAVCLVLAHVQVILTFNTGGQVILYAAPFFEMIGDREDACVYVNLNRIIAKLFKKLGKDYDFTYKTTSESLGSSLESVLIPSPTNHPAPSRPKLGSDFEKNLQRIYGYASDFSLRLASIVNGLCRSVNWRWYYWVFGTDATKMHSQDLTPMTRPSE